MTQFHGRFVWYELMTNNVAQAEAFYRDVVGWTTTRSGHVTGLDYRLFAAPDGSHAAGYMELPEDARKHGAPTGWLGYVQVDDLDASMALFTAEGGHFYFGPMEIPEVGRFAVGSDPQGARIGLFEQSTPADPPQNARGHVGWNELYAGNYATAFDFYEKLFGWVRTGSMDMGDMGPYQMFAPAGEEHPRGGMMDKPEASERAFWFYYFDVESADAAAERILALDGEILQAPMQVPGGQWIVQAEDPEGNKFAVVAPVK